MHARGAKSVGRLLLILPLVFFVAGCRREAATAEAQEKPKRVLEAAVAGVFYPKHQEDLAKNVDALLAAARPQPIRNLRALICPHADYRCSGGVAAFGYKQLVGRKYGTVIVLGPSHRAIFQGAAVTDAEAVQTPLGQIPVSPKAARLAAMAPFALHPKCEVQRPEWWQLASSQLPAFGQETPFTFEHSVEVQLPFLQRVLKDFTVVPAVMGNVEPEEAAEAILKVLDDDTLLVASSDLTHYLPYDLAKSLDKTSTQAMCAVNVDWLEAEEETCVAQGGYTYSLACGIKPILTVMHIAQRKGWQAKLLEYQHSSDVTRAGKTPGVGYAAIAFYGPSVAESTARPAAPGPSGSPQAEFSAADRKSLLELARRCLVAAADGKETADADAKGLPAKFSEPRACFVTLKEAGQLRGCIGSVFPREPLAQAVMRAARGAAVGDPRFSPVTPAEVGKIEVEISVLTIPRRLRSRSPADLLAKLRPEIDGVVLRVGPRSGLFLPQVWEQLPDKEQFLNRLASEKAGLEASAWRQPDARILVFQVEAFKESK